MSATCIVGPTYVPSAIGAGVGTAVGAAVGTPVGGAVGELATVGGVVMLGPAEQAARSIATAVIETSVDLWEALITITFPSLPHDIKGRVT
jgi:hypothetical protein